LIFTLISYVGSFVGSIIIFLAEEFMLKKNDVSFYWSIQKFASSILSSTEISKKLLINVFFQSVGMIIFHLPTAVFLYLFYHNVLQKEISKILKGIRMSRINFYIMLLYFFIIIVPFITNIDSQHNVVNLFEKVLIFIVIFLSAFLEEFIHRGLIFSYLMEILSTKSAVLISSMIFSLTHVDIFSVNFVNFFVDRIIFGIIAAVIYEISNDILTVALIHSLNNYTIILSRQNLYFTSYNISYTSIYYLAINIILIYFIEKSKGTDLQIFSNDKISNNLKRCFIISHKKEVIFITTFVVTLLLVFLKNSINDFSTFHHFIQLIFLVLVFLNVNERVIYKILSVLKNNSLFLELFIEAIIYLLLIAFLSPKFKGILLTLVALGHRKNRYTFGRKPTLILTLLIILAVLSILFGKIIVVETDIPQKFMVLFSFILIYFFSINSNRKISLILVGVWIILSMSFNAFGVEDYTLSYFYYSAMIILSISLYRMISNTEKKDS